MTQSEPEAGREAKRRGCFITLEGVEGVGKSTNLRIIEALLRERQVPLLTTREPGGTPLAEKIRSLLLDHEEVAMADMTELLLVFAARAQHVQELIEPALKAGTWVLCDRFTDSTFAYQGQGRQIDTTTIEQLDKLALSGFKPDLTLLLDIDVPQGLARAKGRGSLDRFELEDATFFESVREGFLQRARADAGRFRLINAGMPLPEVQAEIRQVLLPFVDKWLEPE